MATIRRVEIDGSITDLHDQDPLWTAVLVLLVGSFFVTLLGLLGSFTGLMVFVGMSVCGGGALIGTLVLFFTCSRIIPTFTYAKRQTRLLGKTSYYQNCTIVEIPLLTETIFISGEPDSVVTTTDAESDLRITTQVLLGNAMEVTGGSATDVTKIAVQLDIQYMLAFMLWPATVAFYFGRYFKVSTEAGRAAVRLQIEIDVAAAADSILQSCQLGEFVFSLENVENWLTQELGKLLKMKGIYVTWVKVVDAESIDPPGPLEQIRRIADVQAKSVADQIEATADLDARIREIETGKQKAVAGAQAAEEVGWAQLEVLKVQQKVERQTALNTLQAVVAQMEVFKGSRKGLPLLLSKINALSEERQVELGTALATALKSEVQTQVAVGDGTALADSIPMAAIIKWLKEAVS